MNDKHGQTAEVSQTRKGGRPRKFAPGRVVIAVRVTPARHADLAAVAQVQGRSLSEEVEFRLEDYARVAELERKEQDILASFDQVMNTYADKVAKLERQIAELRREAALNDAKIVRIAADAAARALAERGSKP
jgi:hypothetical protein